MKKPKSKAAFVFDVYRDVTDQWRWRLWSRNGRVVADSAEAYKRVNTCTRFCARLGGQHQKFSLFVEGEHQWG